MAWNFFVKGLVIGFSLAMPVGPIGLLCIGRTLARGRLAGLFSGLGAATADGLYGAVAGFGITVVSSFLVSHQMFLRVVGGIALVLLGIRIFFTVPSFRQTPHGDLGPLKDYLSTLVLTLTNPVTILAFAAWFAGIGLGQGQEGYDSTIALITGVFLGSALWWLVLSGIVSYCRDRIDRKNLTLLNRFSGLGIALFGFVIFFAASTRSVF